MLSHLLILARRFHDSSGPSEKFDFFPKTGKGILDAAISLVNQ
jgi:hypothetical protein